jgi:two-component system, response regulator YesN
MFKIIIVDDERATRQKLVENIEWDKLNIQVAGEAKDGVEGLELVKSIQPDIVLLDVRMPKMNGIECASRIKEANYECKIIFLSGFTDKEYLKSAIQLKAVDYIEKPINLDELFTVLKKTTLQCIKENEIYNIIGESVLLKRQELALDMICKIDDLNTLKKRFKDAQMDISFNDNYISILLRLNMHLVPGIDSSIIVHKVKTLDIIYKTFEERTESCIVGVIDSTHIVIHVFGKTAENISIIKEVIKKIQNCISGTYHSDGIVSVGVGNMVRGIEYVYKSYQLARKALEKSFLEGYDCIVFYDEKTQLNGNISADIINHKLREYLMDGNLTEALCLVENLVKDIKAQSENIRILLVKEVFLSLMTTIYALAKENGLYLANDWSNQQLQWTEILNTHVITEVADFIIDKLVALFNLVDELRGKSKKIRMAMEFVKKHYMEDISVVTIAEKIELRSTYLSTLFKKETGITLGEYIEFVRIEKAKELLKNQYLKLTEISSAVGYNNANYFSTVFKKVTGIFPSDYRRKSELL